MFKFKQVGVVDRHLKLVVGAQDLHLQKQKQNMLLTCPHDGAFKDSCTLLSMSNLKRLSLDEGKVLQVSLLFAPVFAHAAVSDDRLPAALIESRVEVKDQIVGRAEVQRDPEQQQQSDNQSFW